MLVPITPAIAADPSGLRATEGWPTPDTADALALQLGPSPGPAWLFTRDGVVIGDGGTHAAPDPRGEVEIGYAVAEPLRNRGYASEAVVAMCRWLLAQPDIRCVVASPASGESRRVLVKAGFASVVGGRYAMLAQ